MRKQKLRYIYNPIQKSFYTKHGLEVIQTGVHSKTGNQFWAFINSVALDAVFDLWVSNSSTNKNVAITT